MFWKSIPLGYEILLDFRIWIAAIIYGGIYLGNNFVISKFLLNNSKQTPIQEFIILLIKDIVNSFIITIIIYFLTLILFGGVGLMEMASAGVMISIILKSLLWGTIFVTGLGFIPIIGNFVSTNSGTQFFIFALVSLIIITGNKEIKEIIFSNFEILKTINISKNDFQIIFPGVLQLLGYIIIASLNMYLLAIPIGFLEEKINIEKVILLLLPTLSALVGFLTISMLISNIKLTFENL